VGDTDHDGTPIGEEIIDAIRCGYARGIGAEIVVVDQPRRHKLPKHGVKCTGKRTFSRWRPTSKLSAGLTHSHYEAVHLDSRGSSGEAAHGKAERDSRQDADSAVIKEAPACKEHRPGHRAHAE